MVEGVSPGRLLVLGAHEAAVATLVVVSPGVQKELHHCGVLVDDGHVEDALAFGVGKKMGLCFLTD